MKFFRTWLEIVKFSLYGNKLDIARRFGVKCAQQVNRINVKIAEIYDY